MIFCTI